MRALLRRWLPHLPTPAVWGVAGERADDELPRGGARGAAFMAVAALIVGVVAAPFGIDLAGSDFGRVLEGSLQVRTDEGWRELEVPGTVPAGAEVRAGEQAARIEVAGGLLTLAEGAELDADPGAPRVRRGSLLVEAEEELAVRVGATTAEGRGDWRVDVGVASRVATYRARLEVDDGDTERQLGRFRQVGVRDGALEPGLRPLRYAPDDVWDEWLLADALAVDRLSERLRGSLGRSYGDAPREAAFYEAFVAVDDTGLAGDLDDLAVTVEDGTFGPPADVLLGVVTVDALRAEAGLSPREAFDRLVELRRAGSQWGLVFVEHDLGPSALRAAADRALEQVEASPPPEPTPDGDGEPADPVQPVDEDGATDPAPAPPGPGDAPATAPGPGPAPDGPDDGDSSGTVDDTQGTVGDAVEDTQGTVGDVLEDTQDTVGDVVEDPGGTVGDAVEDVEDTVGDLIEDPGGTVGDAVEDTRGLLEDGLPGP